MLRIFGPLRCYYYCHLEVESAFALICLHLSILQTRSVTGAWRVVAVTPQPRHWLITVNNVRSRHSGHATAEWGGRAGVAAACAASSRTDVWVDLCRVHRCLQWQIQVITPRRGVMLVKLNLSKSSCIDVERGAVFCEPLCMRSYTFGLRFGTVDCICSRAQCHLSFYLLGLHRSLTFAVHF